ncbi:hypothetical protein ScPMuIL_011506 [Solemya velum]
MKTLATIQTALVLATGLTMGLDGQVFKECLEKFGVCWENCYTDLMIPQTIITTKREICVEFCKPSLITCLHAHRSPIPPILFPSRLPVDKS